MQLQRPFPARARCDRRQYSPSLRQAAGCVLLLTCLSSAAAELLVQFCNLHNPYFPDRAPTLQANENHNYKFAPPPAALQGIEGDTVTAVFTVVSSASLRASIATYHPGEVTPAP